MNFLRLWSKLIKIYKYYIHLNSNMIDKKNPAPGDGLRSVRTTTLFRAVNFELYTKPVSFSAYIKQFSKLMISNLRMLL